MKDLDFKKIGEDIHELICDLYPICRSITGNGVRETLSRINEQIELNVYEVPTGTQVFDWTVPREWNIRDAYIKNDKGERVVDFQKSNLHVVSYSVPVNRPMELSELREHLHSIPEQPDWIPYRTSYYNENWGFCLTHQQYESLEDGTYDVCIDSTLENGSLTYAECFIPGSTSDEILLFSHTCHPSLCNDNLSGVALATFLAKTLSQRDNRYSYRFIFAPATIGSITWLSQNISNIDKVRHGIVIAVVGDSGRPTYKLSRFGNANIDRAVLHALRHHGNDFEVLEFSPYGYDERQFCSPGINLPIGRLTRTPNGCYPEYHTSADNTELVRAESLADSFKLYCSVFDILENNITYINTQPFCEPQLGRRGLYRKTGGHKDIGYNEYAMLWILNQSDGEHSLLDIADRADIDFSIIYEAARKLQQSGLLREAGN